MMEARDLFHKINIKRKDYFNELLDAYDLNLIELEILVFLHSEPNCNTFTHIMKSKDYAKSYISTAINRLVAGRYLEKTGTTENKKIYYLHLLEKSDEVIRRYDRCVQNFQAQAFTDISEENLDIFNQVLKQINQNLQE